MPHLVQGGRSPSLLRQVKPYLSLYCIYPSHVGVPGVFGLQCHRRIIDPTSSAHSPPPLLLCGWEALLRFHILGLPSTQGPRYNTFYRPPFFVTFALRSLVSAVKRRIQNPGSCLQDLLVLCLTQRHSCRTNLSFLYYFADLADGIL